MGQYDAHSRRGNKSDFYVTPSPCIDALLDFAIIEHGSTILDPCCGTGVIGKVLKERKYKNITEYDLVQGVDFYDEKEYYDIIIANPPYSEKNQFINKALEIANDIYMILPVNVINYNHFHRNYLNRDEYVGRYLLTPKFFMTNKETKNPKRGGISSYAWFHWNSNATGRSSVEEYIDLERYFIKD